MRSDLIKSKPSNACGVILVSAALLTSGCGVESETLANLEQISLRSSGSMTELEQPLLGPATPKRETVFTVPFPDRHDPFHVEADLQSEPKPIVGAAHIHVIGFANVDRPLAILQIGEQTRTVAAGDRVGEIEVISIEPPRVRLKNGNLVWDTSMFQ